MTDNNERTTTESTESAECIQQNAQQIYLWVPRNISLPAELWSLTPEQTQLILEMGLDCLRYAQAKYVSTAQQEWANTLREEYEHKYRKAEACWDVERAAHTANIQHWKTLCAEQENQWKLRCARTDELLREQQDLLRRTQESKQLQGLEQILEHQRQQHQNQQQQLTQWTSQLTSQWNSLTTTITATMTAAATAATAATTNTTAVSSSAKRGAIGEQTFEQIARRTFQDFSGFEMKDVHAQGGEGDFHLHFAEFDLLVDAKNYRGKIPSKEREKIRADLKKNEHLSFAWLVSLNTSIEKFDRAPIMFEWISTSQCIVYINKLMGDSSSSSSSSVSSLDPEQLLRAAWFFCKELTRLLSIVSSSSPSSSLSSSSNTPEEGKEEEAGERDRDRERGQQRRCWSNQMQDELDELRDKQFRGWERIRGIRKIIRELNTTITVFKRQVETMDGDLKEWLEQETGKLVDSHFGFMDNWWNQHIEWIPPSSDNSSPPSSSSSQHISNSTQIWYQFRQDNKAWIGEMQITPEKFRQYITSKLPITCYITKKKGGTLDITGIQWKTNSPPPSSSSSSSSSPPIG